MGVTGLAKLPKGPAAGVRRRVAGDLAGGATTLPADDRRRLRQAICAAEVSQVGELLDALAQQGVRVRVRDGSLIYTGKPRDWFGECAVETLIGREPAVERALAVAFERGPEFAELLAARRESAEGRRRARKPRTRRRRASGDVPVPVERPVERPLEQPVGAGGAAAWLTAGSERLLTPAPPLPPVPTFAQEPEP